MKFTRLLMMVWLSAVLVWPLAVFAQGEQAHTFNYVNPAPWIGWVMFVLALVIPVVVSRRIRGGGG